MPFICYLPTFKSRTKLTYPKQYVAKHFSGKNTEKLQ